MRLTGYVMAALLVWTTGTSIAQSGEAAQNEKSDRSEHVTTAEDLDRVMKKAQPAMQATGKALSSKAYADAKTQIATVKQAIVDSQQFWVEKKRDDGVKMNQDTVEKIEVLEKALSADAVDASAAMTALKDVGLSCRTCHQKYRGQDAESNYIIKPGSLDAQ